MNSDIGELQGKKGARFAVKIERHGPLYHKKVRLYIGNVRGGGPQNILCRLENTKAKTASLPRPKNALLDNGEEQGAKGKDDPGERMRDSSLRSE